MKNLTYRLDGSHGAVGAIGFITLVGLLLLPVPPLDLLDRLLLEDELVGDRLDDGGEEAGVALGQSNVPAGKLRVAADAHQVDLVHAGNEESCQVRLMLKDNSSEQEIDHL